MPSGVMSIYDPNYKTGLKHSLVISKNFSQAKQHISGFALDLFNKGLLTVFEADAMRRHIQTCEHCCSLLRDQPRSAEWLSENLNNDFSGVDCYIS